MINSFKSHNYFAFLIPLGQQIGNLRFLISVDFLALLSVVVWSCKGHQSGLNLRLPHCGLLWQTTEANPLGVKRIFRLHKTCLQFLTEGDSEHKALKLRELRVCASNSTCHKWHGQLVIRSWKWCNQRIHSTWSPWPR